jgi:hypothetical protein
VLRTDAAHEATDVVCPTDLALAAFNRAGEPKRLELHPGGHFSAYTDQFDRAAKAATGWFTHHLQPYRNFTNAVATDSPQDESV